MDSSNSSVTAKPSIPSDSQLSSVCISCNKPLDGQFVRALGGVYHLDCFKCLVRGLLGRCTRANR